jgi:tungstate transport system permease protein
VEWFDSEVLQIVWLSLEVSGTALLISSLAGIPLGAWLGLSRFRGKSVVSVLIHTGMGLPPVIVGLLVYLLLSRSGPFAFLDWLFTPQAMILAQAILALPFVIGITMTSVASLPSELLFQVRSLGASPWQARWTLLRESRQGVLLAVAAAFGRSISEVGAVLMVGGNIQGHTRVLTTAIILETSKGQFALALALGAWLLMLALLVNVLIFRLQGRQAP